MRSFVDSSTKVLNKDFDWRKKETLQLDSLNRKYSILIGANNEELKFDLILSKIYLLNDNNTQYFRS